MKPLLVFAMKEEMKECFEGYDVLHTHIGKVNASYALMKRLAQGERPDIVINLGTTGSRKFASGEVVNPTRFMQRDMDVRPLGFDLGQVPFSDDPVILHYGEEISGLKTGLCGTGDNFDVSEEAAHYDVVDMEAYALALICSRENIPFLCLKYISDGADGAAHEDFNESLKNAALKLSDTLKGAGY